MKETVDYFHKRYQRAEEMFNSHKDEIIKIAREKISRKGYEFSDLAGRLGLGSEDRTIALLFDTYLGILTVDDRYSEDKKVDLGLVETRAYEVARAVKQEVLSNLDVENQMEEAYRDFDRGKGWYFETREGKAALSGLKTERKESDIS